MSSCATSGFTKGGAGRIWQQSSNWWPSNWVNPTLAHRGEIDRACAALTASLAVAQTGGLQMTIQRVAGVRRSSLRDSTNPAVKRLDEGLLDVLAGE